METYIICFWLIFLKGMLITAVVSDQCSVEDRDSCNSLKTSVKDCMCSCLEVKQYDIRYLSLYTNYRCANLLRTCNGIWTVSIVYTVVNATIDEELLTSEEIKVPYDKEIIIQIQGLKTEGQYVLKIKPSCTFCGDDCFMLPFIDVIIPKEKKHIENHTVSTSPMTLKCCMDHLLVLLSCISLLVISLILLNIMICRRKRRRQHCYTQTSIDSTLSA